MYFAGGRPDAGFMVKNSIVWDCGSGVLCRNDGGLAATGFPVDHLTAGNLIGHVPDPITGDTRNTSGYGVFAYNGDAGTVRVTNSIFYNIEGDAALHGWPLAGSPSGCNVLYENGTNYRDATVLNCIGVSGTYHGENGWNEITTQPLWPWPNEERIRQDMRQYTYTGLTSDGTIETLSGNRGFCADNQTLTKYVWEYLGNPMPTQPPADTTPPSAPGTLTIE